MSEPVGNWKSYLEYASHSDVGLRRSNNQDSLAVALAGSEADWQKRGHLFMVADGMGAHAAGELASRLACGCVPHTYRKAPDALAPDALRSAIQESNTTIHERGEANAEFHGMGTTASVLVLLPQGALAGHVGDSRVYRLRKDRLDQLTFDHSLAWEINAAGGNGKGATFVPKNIITRSLGPQPQVLVDLEGPFAVEVGDVFLICSDGLTGPVKDEEIAAAMGSMRPEEATKALVDLANLRGGPDNISVVIVRVTHSPPRAVSQPTVTGETFGERLGKVHPAIWTGMGSCCLAALGLLLVQQWIPAAVCGGLALLTLVIALAQAAEAGSETVATLSGAPLGKGPHVALNCPLDESTTESFANVANELRQAAAAEGWSADWSQYDRFVKAAKEYTKGRQYRAAVREYLLTVSFLMDEIRRHRRVPPQDRGDHILG
jgi:protein phosphatase